MKSAAENKLIEHLKEKQVFTRKDLHDYFFLLEGELNEGTLGWRIYDLKKKNLIQEVKRGVYTVNRKPSYSPVPDNEELKIAELFTSSFRHDEYCVWNIDWINEFTVHQFNTSKVIIETAKDLFESLSAILKKNNYFPVPLSFYPLFDEFKTMESAVLVKPLISRSPLQISSSGSGNEIKTPALEKIIVDVYADQDIFDFLGGKEFHNILKFALTRYSVNYTTLLGYAERRGLKMEIKNLIEKYIPETSKR